MAAKFRANAARFWLEVAEFSPLMQQEWRDTAAGIRAGADFERRCGDCEYSDHLGGVQYECNGIQGMVGSFRFDDDKACGRWKKRRTT